MPYNFYRYDTIKCPNCETCGEHRQPNLLVGKRYFRRNDDGSETPITEEEFKRGAYRYRDQPGNRPG